MKWSNFKVETGKLLNEHFVFHRNKQKREFLTSSQVGGNAKLTNTYTSIIFIFQVLQKKRENLRMTSLMVHSWCFTPTPPSHGGGRHIGSEMPTDQQLRLGRVVNGVGSVTL